MRPTLLRHSPVVVALGILASCGPQEDSELAKALPFAVQEQALRTNPVDPARELVITDLSVVEDPIRTAWKPGSPGAWSFGEVMRRLAGSRDVSAFTLEWLRRWEVDQNVNGYTAPARPDVRRLLIDPWLVRSGCAAGSNSCAKLDFSTAPFRLLAITNRIDLRKVPTWRDAGNAGEGRFVFGALDYSDPTLANPKAMNFTVIFEYELVAWSQFEVLVWAWAWHSLGNVPFGSEYNNRLQAITDFFSKPGLAFNKPNLSALNQIRTNDVSLSPAGADPTNPPSNKLWELREFNLVNGSSLKQVTVKQTPNLSFNGSSKLAAFLNANKSAVLKNTHTVPSNMLDASSPTPFALDWTAPGVSDNVVHAFAMSTCSGCHRSETGTSFLHVTKRELGVPSNLSAQLANVDIPARKQRFEELLGQVENFLTDGDEDHDGITTNDLPFVH